MVLVRTSTGESWNGIMYDTCPDEGSCVFNKLYWIIFMLISFFIFLNVLVAVIFEEFVQETGYVQVLGELMGPRLNPATLYGSADSAAPRAGTPSHPEA